MPLLKERVGSTDVRLFVLPPAIPRYKELFIEFARTDVLFGLDVETTAIDEDQGTWEPSSRLRMVQFGTETEAWCLDPHDPYWRRVIRTMLRGQGRRFVSHTNYDPLWIEREFKIKLGDRSIDTLPMAALLFPGERNPKDLKILTAKFITPKLIEAEQRMMDRFAELAPRIPTPDKNGKIRNMRPVGKKLKAWGFTNVPLDDEAFGRYAGLDSVCVRILARILGDMLKKEGMAKLSRREQRVSRMAHEMQTRGMRIDRDYTNRLFEEVGGEYDRTREGLYEVFGFTPGSPRVGPWLEERGVKFPAVMRTKGGAPSLAKENLEILSELYPPDPFAQADEISSVVDGLWTLSKRKDLRTKLNMILVGEVDGFVHPRINTQMANTGRMSVVRPAMQTFTKNDPRSRGCFITADGETFVGADYDGQEIVLAAAFSKDELLTSIVLQGLNQHDETMKRINELGIPCTRQAAKILNFAQQYGAGPKKIAAQLGITYAQARKLWEAWRKAYKGLVAWTDYMSRADVVVNPWGRQIPADPHRRYANGNYAVQSSGRDLLGDAMCRLADAGWADTLWLPIHDELVLSVPDERVEEAVTVLKSAMRAEVSGMTLTASAKVIGKRWSGNADLGLAA